jgi:peptidoglycan/LPS O-acetylase OafA/YrhL
LLAVAVSKKIKTGRWNLRDYIVDRVFRVYVILLPALLLTILFDQMGQALFSSTGLWNGTNPNFLQKFDTAFAAQDSVGLFACNVVMLQPFYCSVLGSNIPLWTLSYEFWFYVAFAW